MDCIVTEIQTFEGDCYVNESSVVSFRSTSQIAASANFYVRVTYPVV